jgi:arylsulfatase A-like enzyme
MMRLQRLRLVPALILVSACAPDPSPEVDRPNILLVVADDHGHWACGPCGSREILTPTMDLLAEEGTYFANAASPSPVCSPARASLLTGRLPSQHGIHDFLSETGNDDRNWLADEVLLPEILKNAGYFTSLFGKWHLSGSGRPPPGIFDRWISYDVGAEGWRNQYHHDGPVHLLDDGEPLTADGPQIEVLAGGAIETLAGRPADRPFFMLVAPTDTHAPFEGHPEACVERYRGLDFADIPTGESSFLPPSGAASVVPEDPTEMLAQYFAAVTTQDGWIGEIIDALSAAGELDRTLVIVTSDHGHMNGHHGLIGKANATLPQNLYDEVVRVPLVMRWPGRIAAGKRSDLFVDHMDLFATMIDAAGIVLDETMRHRISSPGRSLLPALARSDPEWRRFRFAEHGNARMVADERWKLVRRYPPLDPRFGDELFNLANDPRETTNLAGDPSFSDEVSRLGGVLDSYFARHEERDKSGTRIMEQRPANGREPWTRLAAKLNSPE